MDYDALAHDHLRICFHLFGRIVLFSGAYYFFVLCVALGGVFFCLAGGGFLFFIIGGV